MSKKFTYEEVKNYIEIESNSGCKLLSTEYLGVFNVLSILCSCGKNIFNRTLHDFKQQKQYLCLECSMILQKQRSKLDLFTVKDTINQLGYTLISEYSKANNKITIMSQEGYKFNVTYGSIQQKHIPKVFFKNNPFTIENIKLWLKINNKKFILLSNVFNGSDKKLLWQCTNQHCLETWSATWGSIISGSSCPFCCNQKVGQNNNLLITHPQLGEEWDYDKNDKLPQDYTHGSDQYVWWKCVKCEHSWLSKINNRTSGKNCPACCISKGEIRIQNYLKHHNIAYQSQKKFNKLIGIGFKLLSYDFYLPDYSLLIEYQGIQHERYTKGLHFSQKDFEKQQEHDKRKREYAKNNNIKLLEIWYWDFDHIEEILITKLSNGVNN